jgi:hypothetical protein
MRCVLCHSSCAQTPVLTYGRIIAESMDGRLNAASVMLEGDDSLSHGYRVKLGALRDAGFRMARKTRIYVSKFFIFFHVSVVCFSTRDRSL